MDLMIQLDISYRLSGQPLGASDTPTLGFTVLLSDRDNPQPSVSFNRGQEMVLAPPQTVSWQQASLGVLRGWQYQGESTVVGVIPLLITSQLCSTVPQSRYMCVRYTLTIPSTDSDMSNDHQCVDISSQLDCSAGE
ncbi:hypothetical protein NP493_1031g00029 [Ridgeia piscesae]|uniref:Uncharacterized protein n=1 Tax=Ridgeia piscesae TaxID=27915 RepID=A0AAD9KJ92_RIDPI|nr:hypothetical protein NP493_1031g00029 [Ridgeia piscesae]